MELLKFAEEINRIIGDSNAGNATVFVNGVEEIEIVTEYTKDGGGIAVHSLNIKGGDVDFHKFRDLRAGLRPWATGIKFKIEHNDKETISQHTVLGQPIEQTLKENMDKMGWKGGKVISAVVEFSDLNGKCFQQMLDVAPLQKVLDNG